MQHEFKLSPLTETKNSYTWESDPASAKYAVLFRDSIIGVFSSLYWAERFSENSCNIEHTIMKVDE